MKPVASVQFIDLGCFYSENARVLTLDCKMRRGCTEYNRAMARYEKAHTSTLYNRLRFSTTGFTITVEQSINSRRRKYNKKKKNL
jgi:hypothetical protein